MRGRQRLNKREENSVCMNKVLDCVQENTTSYTGWPMNIWHASIGNKNGKVKGSTAEQGHTSVENEMQ